MHKDERQQYYIFKYSDCFTKENNAAVKTRSLRITANWTSHLSDYVSYALFN